LGTPCCPDGIFQILYNITVNITGFLFLPASVRKILRSAGVAELRESLCDFNDIGKP